MKTKTAAHRQSTSGAGAKAPPRKVAIKAPSKALAVIAPAVPVGGSEDAYNRFLDAAQAVAPPLLPFRADASLAYHNVATGLAAVLAQETRLRAELQTFDLEAAKSLPDLALALVFANTRVDRSPGASGTTQKLLAQASALRSLLLISADALAHAGILAQRAIDKIRAGHGKIDLATDCVELAALFRANAAAVSGKTAVSADQIDEAATVGSQLLAVLRPKGTPQAGTAKDVKAAIALRDRYWTLLVRGHADLRRAGGWLFGDELDRNVPPLQSRAKAKRKPPAPAPAPVASAG